MQQNMNGQKEPIDVVAMFPQVADISDATLRKGVEGPFHDPKVTQKIPDLTTYRQSANAERAAGVIGLKNMSAGFFLGRVDLIGKK